MVLLSELLVILPIALMSARSTIVSASSRMKVSCLRDFGVAVAGLSVSMSESESESAKMSLYLKHSYL